MIRHLGPRSIGSSRRLCHKIDHALFRMSYAFAVLPREANMWKTIPIAFVVLCFSTYSWAATGLHNGNGFWDHCHEDSPPTECWAFFQGIMHGTAQAIDFATIRMFPEQKYEQFNATRQKLMPICLPANATSGQALDVFLKYLKDNPQSRNRTTGMLYIVAMTHAFPCQPGP